MHQQERNKIFLTFFIFAAVLLLFDILYYTYDLLDAHGLGKGFIDRMFTTIEARDNAIASGSRRGVIIFDHFGGYTLKIVSLILISMVFATKHGRSLHAGWGTTLCVLGLGLTYYFLPYFGSISYIIFSLIGAVGVTFGIPMLIAKLWPEPTADNDMLETFAQGNKRINTKYSITIPYRFQWQHQNHTSWISIPNPFKACLIMGVPGSGKSFAVYSYIMRQTLQKGFSAAIYDYKQPALTKEVYNYYLQLPNRKKIDFCVLNFDDVRYSMRCNPLNPNFFTDTMDAHEVAEVLWKNLRPSSGESKDPFFEDSAKLYVASLVWLLKKYKNGKYCTFAHLIELISLDYNQVLDIIEDDEELRSIAQPFIDANNNGAQDQLQGQIASARIPLLKFPSKTLYWILTGDDFTLDINDPDHPKIFCMGNNPDRQAVYGVTLALFTSRLFKIINHPTTKAGKPVLPSAIILDELPTIFIKGLDQLIATARSNKVAIFAGAQDKSQLIRDYTEKEANVIFNTMGTIISGRVNGETAKKMSETFGKEYRKQQSMTTGSDSGDTFQTSFHQVDLMPQSKIENLGTGYFFGKVADDIKHPLKHPMFCGQIIVDAEARKREEEAWKDLPLRKDMTVNGQKLVDLFGDDEIAAKITSRPNYYSMLSIKRSLAEENLKERMKNPSALLLDEEDLTTMAEAKLKEIDDQGEEASRKFLEHIIEEEQKRNCDEILEANYYRVKDEIKCMLADLMAKREDHQIQTKKAEQQGGGQTVTPTNENSKMQPIDNMDIVQKSKTLDGIDVRR